MLRISNFFSSKMITMSPNVHPSKHNVPRFSRHLSDEGSYGRYILVVSNPLSCFTPSKNVSGTSKEELSSE